jgi:hypothetical protein
MSWFSSRRSDTGKQQGKQKDDRPASETEPQVHRSLGLAALLSNFRPERKLQVLDLGPAIGSNVEFFSQYGCKLYIEDLYAALSARNPSGSDGEEANPQFFAEFLPLAADTRIDVVLAWDTFNYLTRKELGHLVRHLRPFCPPGALVFALMSILKQIPAQPMRFRIRDTETLVYEPRTAAQRPAPRFAPAEMNDLFRGFRVDRSFLLRHGIQEYLFLREADAAGK